MKLSTITEFNVIVERIKERKMSPQLAYRINKIVLATAEDANFFKDSVQKIVMEYSLKDEDGEVMFSEDGQETLLDPEKIPELNRKMEELYNIEIDYDVPKIKLEEINCIQDLELSVEEMSKLMPFIEEEIV